jgi:hypothetical protein
LHGAHGEALSLEDDTKAVQRVVGTVPDGKWGPASMRACVAWFREHGHLEPAPMPVQGDARARVVDIARGRVGEWTEDMVNALWRRVGVPQFAGHWHDKAWCGAFALDCLNGALGTAHKWKPSVGFIYPLGLRVVSLPEPGDIAYFAQGQHHAIVEDFRGGKLYTVDGNALTAPREGVALRERANPAVTYYSIGKLLHA